MPTRKSLKTADARLRLLEDKMNVGIWTWDLDTSEVIWSPGVCRMLGVDPHAVVPTIDLYQSLVHPEDQVDFDDAIGLASDRRLRDRRFRVIRPDGSLKWIHSMAQPHFDRNGRVIMMVGVVMDVTEEETLRATLVGQKEYARIASMLSGGKFWRAYPNGKLIETAEWTKLTGQTPSEAHDWDRLAAIHPQDRQTFRDAWCAAMASGQYSAKIRVRTTDGTYVRIASQALPMRGADGSIQSWIGHSVFVGDERHQDVSTGVLVSSAQIRAARAYLGWTGPELAAHAGVSFSTIRRVEHALAAVRPDSIVRVRQAFERHGVQFARTASGGINISFQPAPDPVSAPSFAKNDGRDDRPWT